MLTWPVLTFTLTSPSARGVVVLKCNKLQQPNSPQMEPWHDSRPRVILPQRWQLARPLRWDYFMGLWVVLQPQLPTEDLCHRTREDTTNLFSTPLVRFFFFLVSSARELVSTLTPGLSPLLHLFTQKSSSHRRFQNVFLFSLPPALCVRSDRKLQEQFAVATSRSLRSG